MVTDDSNACSAFVFRLKHSATAYPESSYDPFELQYEFTSRQRATFQET